MRKAAIGIVLIVVLVVAALFAVPQLVDLGGLKTQIAAYVRERTGRSLDIAGPIGLRLLPGPAISARDLRFANPPGAAAPDMVRLRGIEVKLAFWPLLSGRIEITSARLIDPEIDLERLPDGSGNWQFHRATAPSPPGAAAAPGRLAAPRFAALAIRQLAIQNGRVTYRSGGAVDAFEHIDGSLAFDSLDGPYRAKGAFVARGASLSFDANGGRIDAGSVPLHLSIASIPTARLDLDGDLSGLGDAPRLTGKLKLSAGDTANLVSTLARLPVPGALAQPLSLAADVAGTATTMTLDHAVVDFGSLHATGHLHFAQGAPSALDVGLRVARLDLDHWAPSRKAEAAPGFGIVGPAFAAAPEATAAIPVSGSSRLPGLALPGDLKADVDIAIDALLWRGGLVRQAEVQATLVGGRLTIRRLGALLPGGGEVAVDGVLSTPQGTPHLDGKAELRADDLRGLLGWLGADLGRVPADRLRRAALTSRVALAGDRLDLTGIDGTLDATHFDAAATILLRQRPGVGLRLAADRFNLDAYLPQGDAAPAALATAPAPAPASPPQGAPAETLLGRFDANLDARLDELTWRGQPLRNLHLVSTMQHGSLSVGSLDIGNLGGASGKVSGTVEGLGAGAPSGQLAYDLAGPEFERVLRLALPGSMLGETFGAFTLGGSLQVSGGAMALDSDLQVLGGHAHLAGDLGGGGVNLALQLDHPHFTDLVRAVAPTYRPQGGDLGALKLAGRVQGSGSAYTVDGLSLAIGDSTLQGQVGVGLGGKRPKLTADLTFGDWQIDRFLPARETAAIDDLLPRLGLRPGVVLAQATAPAATVASSEHWSAAPMDWSALGLADADLTLKGHSFAYRHWRIDAPAAKATLADGALDVAQLTGTMFGGSLAASGALQSAGAPGIKLKLALRGADLRSALAEAAGVGVVTGRFDFDAQLAGAGQSQRDLVAHLDGEAKLDAHDGTLAGVDIKGLSDRLSHPGQPADLLGLLKAGAGGTTRFSRLDGTFHLADGVARSDDLHLVAEAADGRATSVVDLPAWTTDTRIAFRLTQVADAPPIVLRLDGSIDDPHKVFDINPLTEFLLQRATRGQGKGEAQDPAKPGSSLRNLLKGLTSRP